jgi:hypothetical protein
MRNYIVTFQQSVHVDAEDAPTAVEHAKLMLGDGKSISMDEVEINVEEFEN